MNITIAKTIEVEQAWLEKTENRKYFGLDVKSDSYYQDLLKEFKTSEFKDGYLSPTYGVVLIDVKLFEQFLRDKKAKKFKTKKVRV